jgi:hypothetical protein
MADQPKTKPAVRESAAEYIAVPLEEIPNPLFSEDDFTFLTQ